MAKRQYPKGKELAKNFLDKLKSYTNCEILSQSDVCHIRIDNNEYFLYISLNPLEKYLLSVLIFTFLISFYGMIQARPYMISFILFALCLYFLFDLINDY